MSIELQLQKTELTISHVYKYLHNIFFENKNPVFRDHQTIYEKRELYFSRTCNFLPFFYLPLYRFIPDSSLHFWSRQNK